MNYFPVEEIVITRRQTKISGPYEHVATWVYATPSLSQRNVNVFDPGQRAAMAEQHTHHVHLSDTTVVQLATEIPKETNNLLYLNNK